MLTDRFTANQGIDAAVPTSYLSIELTHGQITVITGLEHTADPAKVAEHQHVRPIQLTPSVRDRH
ncbi:hypothetical protein D3C81_1853610 [compost metagenome]